MQRSRFSQVRRAAVLAAAVMVSLGSVGVGQEVVGQPGETPEQRDARMKWWREARFGMFIHWGVYSVPAGTYNGKQIPASASGS